MYFLKIYVRGNISVTNWKELNSDFHRIYAEYCGGLKEEERKKTENVYCSVTG